MANNVRIKNVDLPRKKRIVIGLQAIYGIGISRAQKICLSAKVDENIKTDDLTLDQINSLRTACEEFVLGGDLKRDVALNIKTMTEIGSYKGIRHRKGLPVRGQNTQSNARTRKGKAKTIANKKK